MNKVKYPFVMYPAIEGGDVGEIPALKGCLAQGETLDETIAELEIVENLWLQTAKESGLRIPLVEVEIVKVKEKLAV